MNLAMKTLSALAIVSATLAVSATASSAIPTNPGVFKPIGVHHVPPAWNRFRMNPTLLGKLQGHPPYHCLVCTLPHPKPYRPHPPYWGKGWFHGFGHWYGRGGVETVAIGGAPSAPVRVSAPAPAPAPTVAASPCSCLTKQTLPDGSVLFQDICTKESALEAPQEGR